MVFDQEGKKSSSTTQNDESSSSKGGSVCSSLKKPTTVCCRSCGELGHTSLVCPHKKPPAQDHAMLAEPDDASICSSSLRTTAVIPPLTRTSSYSTARAQLIYSPTPLMLTMFVQLFIPSKFTATRVLCRPITSLISDSTRYMSTRMASPMSSHYSC